MKTGKLFWRPQLDLRLAFLILGILLNFDYPAAPLFSWRLLLPSLGVWLLMPGTRFAFPERAYFDYEPGFWRISGKGKSGLIPIYLREPRSGVYQAGQRWVFRAIRN